MHMYMSACQRMAWTTLTWTLTWIGPRTRTPTYICPKDARPAPTMSEAAPELSLEEKKAAKRKEIEERLAGLKLQQEKEASQKTMYFGEHPGITCDGCGACPMVGYRYTCKQATAANTPAQHPSHRLRC